MLAIALAAGLLVGLSLGALGGGGSILTVPALVYLLGMTPHAATTGSLLIVGGTAIAGTLAHARTGRVRWRQGLLFSAVGVAGAVAGSRLSATVAPDVLLAAFAGLLVVAATAMGLRQWRARHLPSRSPDRVAPPRHPHIRMIVAAATAVGLLTGFFGVGGGFLVVPALVLALGFDMPTAVGTSLLVIALNSATALTARLGTPVDLNWPLLLTFGATAIAGGLLGGHLAGRVRPDKLSVAFTLLLIAVAGYTAARSLPHLI